MLIRLELVRIRLTRRLARWVGLRAIAVHAWASALYKQQINAPAPLVGLAKHRFGICQTCPKLTGPTPLETCSACGCFMRAKVELTGARCPEKRW